MASLMMIDLDEDVSLANEIDIPHLVTLVNRAYHGAEGSWTSLNSLFRETSRTHAEDIREMMQRPDSVFIKHQTVSQIEPNGCLYLETIGVGIFHLWMMAVEPSRQNQGVGKRLLIAAEDYTRAMGYKLIEFTTTAYRPEVVSWYERRGYINTGKQFDFDVSSIIPSLKETIPEILFEKHFEYAYKIN